MIAKTLMRLADQSDPIFLQALKKKEGHVDQLRPLDVWLESLRMQDVEVTKVKVPTRKVRFSQKEISTPKVLN